MRPFGWSCTLQTQLQLLQTSYTARISSRWGHTPGLGPVTAIIGATGTGKSQLSIDLARHHPSEIINADKMQLYRGLDITTNKIPPPHQKGVPHHLLGDLDPALGEISALHFRSIAAAKISDILARSNLPIIAGGSNSFIHALLTDRYEPTSENNGFGSPPARFRYECCFLWLDVSEPVLSEYLTRRVDSMLEMGMFEELARFYGSGSCRNGLRNAIGVPEFGLYFRRFGASARPEGDLERTAAFEEAVDTIKENTCRLAERQMAKIQRLRSAGWNLHRFDATEAFRAALSSDSAGFREVWARDVVKPSLRVVNRFLEGRLTPTCAILSQAKTHPPDATRPGSFK